MKTTRTLFFASHILNLFGLVDVSPLSLLSDRMESADKTLMTLQMLQRLCWLWWRYSTGIAVYLVDQVGE